MTTDHHGAPCWYELTTGDLGAAQTYYADLLGWSWADAGMEGFDYRLASMGGTMVAGASMGAQLDTPPSWLTYFAVTDCDATAKAVADAGGAVHMPPADIPGTGRFAILADPQGASFGILQPLLMPDGSAGGAFDQQKPGHGNWHELMTSDPKAALDFYGKLFGWAESRVDGNGPRHDLPHLRAGRHRHRRHDGHRARNARPRTAVLAALFRNGIGQGRDGPRQGGRRQGVQRSARGSRRRVHHRHGRSAGGDGGAGRPGMT